MHRVVDLLLICSFLHPYFHRIESFVTDCQSLHSFRCENSKCIPFTFECDEYDDCGDNSDERNCEDFKLIVPASIQCARDEFRCEDAKCIPKGKFCDAVPDCADKSDEYIGCVKKLKCRGKFRCSDGHCIARDWVCDGAMDCPDGSDEQNCGNKILNASDCTNKNDRYLCKNQRCISLSTVCNGKDNCGDGSDEGVGCKNSTMSCASMGCSDMCRMTPNGPVCTCRAGYILQDNRTCIDIDECAIYGTCDQRCINTKGSYKCICQTGYMLLDDMRTCRADGGEATMIYSTTTKIRGVYLTSGMYFTAVRNLSHVVGVAMNKDYIYWSEVAQGNEAIVKSKLYRRKNEVIATAGLDVLTDIAVDWITGNIYFTDEGYARIGVCDNNGTYCTVLINEQINKPKGLALLPNKGIMYWSDWGPNAHIAMAGMDGKNSHLFVTKNIKWPISVTIDYPNNRLYWVDAKLAVVESIRLDGSDRRTVLHELIQHPFSLAVFENKLYWSDWTEKTIQSCNKFTGKDWEIMTRTSNTPYGVHIEHPALKPKIRNPCYSKPCSQLCMLNQNESYTCACTLDKDLKSDKHTCRDMSKRQHIIIAAKGVFIDYYHELLGKPKITANETYRHITAVTYDSLSGVIFASDQFKNNIVRYDPVHGDTETFISMRNEILGGMAFDDIGNNLYLSDIEQRTIEVHSLSSTANTTFYFEEQLYDIALVSEEGVMFVVFRGENGYHIDKMHMTGIGVRTKFVDSDLLGPKVSLCYDRDQRKIFWGDQGTGSIESAAITGFNKYLFRTGLNEPVSLTIAGEYIFWTQRRSDRLFWADKNDIHQKNNGVLIPTLDKVEIAHLIALHGITVHEEYGCRKNNGNCSHVCLPSSDTSYICACPSGMTLSADNHTCSGQSICPAGEIKCGGSNDVCIKRQQWCNGIKECPDGEDEPNGCKESGHCGKDKFMCKNGQCINREDWCNSRYDCADRSDEDEEKCKAASCRKDEFRCHEGNCISSSLVCNGQFDCFDTSDELNCETHKCSSNEFTCDMRKCIPKIWKCDGQTDCPDGSDEAVKICKTSVCNDGQFRCANGRCISSSMKCDGFNDCGDESDEQHCLSGKHGHTGNCTDGEYPCYNTDICLPKKVRCNGVQDCPKNDDEHDCAYCFEDQFTCDNLKCIPQTWVCDKTDDCGDKSDEKGCGRSNWKKTVVNSSDICEEFMCSSGTCLPFSKVCDGVQDCPDGSDEQEKCATSCMQNNRCHGLCHKTPRGGVCGCVKGYRLAADMVSCDEINECEHDVCSQLCHNSAGSFVCSCFDGYIIRDDKISCKAIGPPMELIAATDRDIRKISSNAQSIDVIYSLPGLSVSGLDVNAIDDAIYWSNDNLGTINKLNVKTKESKFVTSVGNPEALAVDWITNNIYFNDNNRPNTIKVCNLEQGKCATIATMEGVGKVTALAVDPKNRWLFWSQTNWQMYNNPFSEIYQTDMMGSNMKIIASRNVGVVSGMAIDRMKSKLYWTDSFYRTIESSNLDGTGRSTFLKTDIYRPLSINIYENSLYWLMGSNGQLQKCQLYGEKLCELVNLGSANIYKHFAILHVSNHPPAENPCKDRNCNYMCVLKDKDTACICQDGKPTGLNSICTADIPSNNKATFASNNTDIRAEPIKHYNSFYSGIFIALVIIILILSGYFYHQKNKLKMTTLNNLSIRFQNPSYDRRDEVAATLISTASNISPGQHEYTNPISNKLLTNIAAEESGIKQSETTNASQSGKEGEVAQKKDTLISFVR
ncbi:vitellogenin receptor isoform X2 [Harpegnathos saltator]|uniref:vitellogenin receptor isoform X2 n=1 Tax=Harpegnathos saltator TaxID=610380 RepID=UPI000DBEDA8B|nr:vitellogenin receptor isoform X2 [Harpegnathos saltator]